MTPDPAEIAELEEAGADGEVKAGYNHEYDQGEAPEHTVEPIQKCDHGKNLSFTLSAKERDYGGKQM